MLLCSDQPIFVCCSCCWLCYSAVNISIYWLLETDIFSVLSTGLIINTSFTGGGSHVKWCVLEEMKGGGGMDRHQRKRCTESPHRGFEQDFCGVSWASQSAQGQGLTKLSWLSSKRVWLLVPANWPFAARRRLAQPSVVAAKQNLIKRLHS